MEVILILLKKVIELCSCLLFFSFTAARLYLLYNSIGVRSHGGQKKRFKETLKASLKDFQIDHHSWETQAHDMTAWCSAIHKGAAIHEQQRIETAKTKRAGGRPGPLLQPFSTCLSICSSVLPSL